MNGAQPMRLAAGGAIDRARPLGFTFDGRAYAGFAGDTLASALLANGVRLMGRSFKYHRPRGPWGAGAEEPNALVELRTGARREPNTRATVIELFDGLVAQSQNRWPSLRFDVMGVNGLFAPIFTAGFYYKTFMWPASFWEKLYEPIIRRAAGLGRAAREPDPDEYDRSHLFCDVLVIGAGPAGLAAALAAARSGARVVLADEDVRPGGRLLAEAHEIDSAPGVLWAERVAGELAGMANVTLLARTTVFGLFDHGAFAALERVADHLPEPAPHQVRQRLWRIQARRAVLAAGAIERPIAFGGNDRPGVMAASAVRAYLHRWAVLPGRRGVVFTASDDGWRTADALLAAGASVEAVVDARPDPPAALMRAAGARGLRVHAGAQVVGTHGHLGLQAVDVRLPSGSSLGIDCDLLAVSGGWNPTVHLASHQGAKPVWDAALAAFVPGRLPEGLAVAGAAAGRFTLAACLADGAEAGRAAASACGHAAAPLVLPRAADEPAAQAAFFHVPGPRGKAFVDFQNDVTVKDVKQAAREGYRSVEHAKRYTTLGMATDQGKTANVVGLAILAEATGRSIEATGTTIFRPPYTPVAMGAIVGHHRGRDFRPARHTPMHDWAAENGASFVEVGPWYRAQWYARPGEKGWRDSVDREAEAVRRAVGVCDVSTLGKIEVVGRDAAAFLDFVYTSMISTLPVGRVRYGLMLREDGLVFDDGTCARMGPERFFITTTTANAGRVMQHLEFCHQVLKPAMDVSFLSVTDRWAQVSIAGPRSRDLVAMLVGPGVDLSTAAFPHMSAAEVEVCGQVPARLFRLSFSGEMAYELGVPADFGDALMRHIMQVGAPLGLVPYGTEALSVLRVEKGHPAGGELNGHTTARDLGLGGMMSRKKDYVGRRLAERPAFTDPARPILVGFKPVDRGQELKSGAHFLDPGAEARIENDQGYMTSVAFSPALGHSIGLGLLARGRERIGQQVRAYDPVRNRDIVVEVCHPVFIDPEGDRTRG
ncbi:MAG: sarcosine oxidase subunit alpha family protein [Alphaproteobacteria bacterium]|nr:sarcosine oxidase subunit alpha family protein [Alphaproteobacteria bacterium]